jgi:hypothetical protein
MPVADAPQGGRKADEVAGASVGHDPVRVPEGGKREIPEVMNRVLQFFGEWGERLERGIPVPPAQLYHYTDARALKSIVGSGELWATNALFMNDQTEIFHAGNLLGRAVYGPEVDKPGAWPPEGTCSSADAAMRRVLSRLNSYVEVYVFCFCSRSDLLSQWRGYGQGGGYEIGFSSEEVTALGGGGLSLVPVIYDEEEQERRTRELVDGWRAVFDEELPAGDDWAPAMAAFLFAQSFGRLAVSFKNAAFKEEEEWRLFYIRPRLPQALPGEQFTLDFFTRDGLVVPYVRFAPASDKGGSTGAEAATARLPIKSIRVGPHRYPPLAASGVWQLLNRYGLGSGEVTIELSRAPLRA